MNRAPSSLDPWWEDHRRTCGGTYTKVKEPEGYGKKGKKDGKKDGKTSEKKAPGNGKPSSTTPGDELVSSAACSVVISIFCLHRLTLNLYLYSLSAPGSQDIRNIIPFSGKGFLLGGSSQPSSKPLVPVVTTSSSSPVSSPKKPCTASSPAKSISSPVHNKGLSGAFPSIRPATSTGLKPPTKRSVSNTRVFVNINGSPVRLSKPHGSSSSSQEANKIKQRSIEDLFSSTSFRKSGSLSSTSNTETKKDSLTSPNRAASSSFPKQQSTHSASSPRTSNPSSSQSKSSVVSTGTKGSPVKPTQSKYFNHSNGDSTSGAAGGGQPSRKRPWDDRSSSATIFNFFTKTLGGDSAASRESAKTTSPAMQQRTATATTTSSSSSASSLHSSAGLHSVSSSSSSSSALMVSCPVCQAKVQESKINQHLDSCLS